LKKHETSKKPGNEDWFATGLKERLPADVRESLTEEQLQALKIAFGARRWGRHPVDLRGTLNVWRSRYYFVFLMGRNDRQLSRRERRLSRVANALTIAAFLLFSLLLGLGTLYVFKSALGINLLPNSSLGLWDWLKAP